MSLVFLVEELSMKVFLEGFLPRVLPDSTSFQIIAHEGKSDLERSIPRKLRAWQVPGAQFVVIRDQDGGGGDCKKVKARLQELCEKAGRSNVLVRIACRELESWFLGDLQAVARAFDLPKIESLADRAKFRHPDTIGSPARERAQLVPGYGKVGGARALGGFVDASRSRSASLRAFEAGVLQLVSRRHDSSSPD